MTQQTEQERLNRFQQYLQKRLSREIRDKHYHESSITIPGSANTLPAEETPYLEEEQEYRRVQKALESISSINNIDTSQIMQDLSNLIERYAPMVRLNNSCRKYYTEILGAVIPIGNLHNRENFDRGLEALTNLSNIQITSDNLENLINSIKEVEENYLYDVEISTQCRNCKSKGSGWEATWSSEPRPIWNKL